MRDRVLPFLAFAVLCGFLGILLWKVRVPDLAGVIAVTLALALWDMIAGRRRQRQR